MLSLHRRRENNNMDLLRIASYNVQHIPPLCGAFYPPCVGRVEHVPKLLIGDEGGGNSVLGGVDYVIFQEAFSFRDGGIVGPFLAKLFPDLDRFREGLRDAGYDVLTPPDDAAPESFPTTIGGIIGDGGSIGGGGAAFLDSGIVVAASSHQVPATGRTILHAESFRSCCGTDCLAAKGFRYLEAERNGYRMGIVGTHLQANDELCGTFSPWWNPIRWSFSREAVESQAEEVRRRQLQRLRDFVDEASRDRGVDVILLVGDLNVDRGSPEADEAFATLGVTHAPIYDNVDGGNTSCSIDPARNTYAAAIGATRREHLDYGLVLKCPRGKVCTASQSVVEGGVFPGDGEQPMMKFRGNDIRHLSDHDPVSITLSIADDGDGGGNPATTNPTVTASAT